eukprot:SAG31_NODE_3330_length_4398_cov_5.734589_8_plen_70_part_00
MIASDGQVIRGFAASARTAHGFCGFALLRPLPEAEQTQAAFTAKTQVQSCNAAPATFWCCVLSRPYLLR